MTNMHTYARLRRCLALLFCFTLGIGVAHAGDTVTYYHTDALGTPVMESNAAGVVTYSREHRPYGEQVLGAAKNGPGFTGHMSDIDSGLVYMQARYYDPAGVRFLSSDPVPTDMGDGKNYNRYWYANNNPFKFVDPDGRKPFSGHLCDMGCDMGSFVAGGPGSSRGAEEKSLEGAPTGAAATDSTARINDAIKAAKGRIEASEDQKAIDDWNKTTWKWDPDNQYFKDRENLAAFVHPNEPYVIHVGNKFGEFYDRSQSVYHNATFAGGSIGMQFVALHEFAHVFTAGQGRPGPAREMLANKTAYQWMRRVDRGGIKCRTCID